MPEHSPITVALVNDYEVVVRGLERMLETYADRVAVVETRTGDEVSRPVDVVLYDTFGHPPGELAGERVARSVDRASHLVVYSWSCAPELVEAALADGADGYVAKQAGAENLVAALERVTAGERVRPASAGPEPADGAVDWPGRAEGLTARESEVVALIVQGLSNAQVASHAFLTVNTVKSYIRSAYRKMGVESRSQAVLWGIDHGFRPERPRPTPPSGE